MLKSSGITGTPAYRRCILWRSNDHANPTRHRYNVQGNKEETRGKRKEQSVGERSKTVRGIVIPADWDDAGNVLAIAVSAPGEKQYIVEQNALEKELKRLIRQEVEVMGVVGKGRKGWNKITVKAYELIKTYG